MAVDPLIPEAIYPFTTKDGKVIPLDIIKSKGLIIKTFDDTSDSVTIPDEVEVAIAYADEACILTMGVAPTLADGTLLSDTYFIPKGWAVTICVIPGTASLVRVSANGTLYLQFMTKWAGLSIEQAFKRQ